MAKRRQSKSKVWAKRIRRVLKKGARRVWKIARLVIHRMARMGRAIWHAVFPRKRRRRRATSQPAAVMAAQPHPRIRAIDPPGPVTARNGQLGLSRYVLRALVGLRRRSARFWLSVIALTGVTIALWWDEPREAGCVLRDRVDISVTQKDWLAVRRWCPLIMHAADRYQLDPHLIAALILVESGGDPQAYSSSGAVGLMQVMPRDGIAERFWCADRPCFADRPSIAELQDPAFNVDYGAMLLRSNVDRYGLLREALRAYGPLYVDNHYADLVLATYERVRP